jgi:hypothetical protein
MQLLSGKMFLREKKCFLSPKIISHTHRHVKSYRGRDFAAPAASSALCSPHTPNPPRAATHTFSSRSIRPAIRNSHQPRTMATPFCAAASPWSPRLPRCGGGGASGGRRRDQPGHLQTAVVDTVLAGDLSKPLTANCRYVLALTLTA